MNRLSINTNKTKYMAIDPYKKIDAWSDGPRIVLVMLFLNEYHRITTWECY